MARTKTVYPEELKKKAKLLYKDGKPIAEVAELLKVPHSTVYTWINSYYTPKAEKEKPRKIIAVSQEETIERLHERIRELEYKHRLVVKMLKD